MNIKSLREQNARDLAMLEKLRQTAEKEDRLLTPDELEKFHKLDEAMTLRLSQIQAAEKMEAMEADADVITIDARSNGRPAGQISNFEMRFGQAIMDFARNRENRDITTSSGHIQNPVVMTSDVIMTLRKHTFLGQLGATFIPDGQNFTQWPKITATPTVGWQSAEGQSVDVGTMTIGSVKATFSTPAFIVKFSKQADRDNPMTAGIITREMTQALSEAVEGVTLWGAAGSYQPVGLDNAAGVQTLSASSATLSSWDKLVDCVKALHAVNVDTESMGWVTGSTVMSQLEKLADSTGQPLMKPPVLASMPYRYSSQVLESYDTNTTSRLYLGDWSQLYVAMSGPYVQNLTERYADTLENAVLCWMGIDIVLPRANNFIILEDIALS